MGKMLKRMTAALLTVVLTASLALLGGCGAATPNFKEIAVLEGHSDAISYVAFSPDSKHVVTASWDGTAKIWDVSDLVG